jgi:hypothetical protein
MHSCLLFFLKGTPRRIRAVHRRPVNGAKVSETNIAGHFIENAIPLVEPLCSATNVGNSYRVFNTDFRNDLNNSLSRKVFEKFQFLYCLAFSLKSKFIFNS